MDMNHINLLADALHYMEENLCNEISTDDVAKACYCSRSTLEKLFRCVNSITIRDYIVRRRMMKAARLLLEQPQMGILSIAIQFGYSTNESFTRAFHSVWNCNPSEYRHTARFTELFPRLNPPIEKGDPYMRERRHVDISELYDLFTKRKGCYFICCDIRCLMPINEISRKAGDLAILETMNRLEEAAGEEDYVFRIGGDEFALMTNSSEVSYAESVAEQILAKNGQPIQFEDREIPLHLHVGMTRMGETNVRYSELFTNLHNAIRESKQ